MTLMPFCLAMLLAADGSSRSLAVSDIPLPGLPKTAESQDPEANPLRNTERAREAMTAFFKTTGVEDMAKHVRHPDRALPRMKAYYGDAKPGPVEFKFSDDWREVVQEKSTLLLTTVQIEFKDVRVVVEVPEDGGPARVDWECYAGWGEMPWAEFVKKGSNTAKEFRVAVAPSDYFNFSYPDAKKHGCFRLVDKDNNETIFAYCEVGSEAFKKLSAPFKQNPQGEDQSRVTPRTFTLKLSMKTDDVAHRQALIEDVVCEGWVAP
jgi:hypothetical protein